MRKDEYANDECLAPDVKRNRFVYGPRFCFGFAPDPILLDCHKNPCSFRIPSKPHYVMRRRLGPDMFVSLGSSSLSIQDISTAGTIRYQRSEETRDKASIKALASRLICAHALMTLSSHQQQKVHLVLFCGPDLHASLNLQIRK